ncbi:MAG: protein-glutamate O-methyltransferase CheR [Campylobacterales bacterium]|nr:protein-glutamate O-methyltransferase CheR [Campylobacterales bacterium]
MIETKITQREFELFRVFIYEEVGISLSEQKMGLVQSRLSKRLKALNIPTFKEYYEYLKRSRDDEEMFHLISAISTNVTSFFREKPQWDYLKANLSEILGSKSNKKLRIWSAACSSGEEPYSIAMFLKENMADFRSWDIKILATDISKKVLAKAISGRYQGKDLEGMPKHYVQDHFKPVTNGVIKEFQINQDLRNLITFRMFNLINGDFSMFRNHFDMIFCRNVMIYFDGESQAQLVSNFHKILGNKSLLFIGHSESLTRNQKEYKTVKPSIYQKNS